MTRKSFAALLRTAFVTRTAEGKDVTLVLTAVEDGPASASAASAVALDNFSLEFSSAGESMAQGTYQFKQATLGTISLFIVPSGSFTYMAVINHLMAPLPPSYSIPLRANPATASAVAENRPVRRPGIQASQKALANG